ncbi:MAG: hypothetical protein COA63_008865 [Methylophaga sp.]|nr:hypothetical protein [Methylophaga sp.]
MNYLIFTQAGFEDAQENVLENNATLWINDGILSDKQLKALSSADITINILPILVNPTHEKEIFAAIETIETEYPDTELFVEYL